jgi:hypothetical protein
MVTRITTRSGKIAEGVAIAVKQDEFTNGRGKKIVQIVEEHGITIEEATEVVDKLGPEELTKVGDERVKLMKEIAEIEEDIKDVITSREFIKFKKELDSEQTKKFFDVLKQERTLNTGKSRLEELNRTEDDVNEWIKQMADLKSQL